MMRPAASIMYSICTLGNPPKPHFKRFYKFHRQGAVMWSKKSFTRYNFPLWTFCKTDIFRNSAILSVIRKFRRCHSGTFVRLTFFEISPLSPSKWHLKIICRRLGVLSYWCPWTYKTNPMFYVGSNHEPMPYFSPNGSLVMESHVTQTDGRTNERTDRHGHSYR